MLAVGMNYFRALSLIVFGLAGCASNDVSKFAGGAPSMAPPDWMVGTVEGYGVIVDRFGTVKSQFHAHENGVWDAATGTLTLTETITYLQGDTTPPTHRVWRFVEQSPGHWTGTANDVIGTATGAQAGNAWHLMFHQMLPVGGHQIAVSVDDWRFREAANVAIDRSVITKLGIELATAEIAFVKS